MIRVGNVETFKDVKPDKAQVLKIAEEVCEVYSAWENCDEEALNGDFYHCGEIVSFDEDYDPKTDLPAYCLRCGSRITGIGEPWQG